MDVLGIIPARGGSKGIPRKNIRLLAGKPLLAHTLEAARASRLSRVVVSTEDAEIAEAARALGGEVLQRPASLAEDDTPTLPVLRDAWERLGGGFQAVMTLQPTSPFRTAAHIDGALELFARHPDADSLVSVVRAPHNMTPSSLMRMGEDGCLSNWQEAGQAPLRRQDKPVLWARNGAAIYITRSDRLAEYVFGGRILAFPMSKLESIDLDDWEDWRLAEALLAAPGFAR